MGFVFNGNVTINGDVEFFDNGSMKITANQVNVSVNDLSQFIEDNLKYSPNKEEYLDSANTLKSSSDKGAIKSALLKLIGMGKELGKGIWITGLSQVSIEVIKQLVQS